MTNHTGLAAFHAWAREAPFNDAFVYHIEGRQRDPKLFEYARKLQGAGLVMLFQHRLDDGTFAYEARRSPVLGHVTLDKLSAGLYPELSHRRYKEVL